jgi:hypothetical protein
VVVEDKITSKLWKCQGKAGALRHYFGVGLGKSLNPVLPVFIDQDLDAN